MSNPNLEAVKLKETDEKEPTGDYASTGVRGMKRKMAGREIGCLAFVRNVISFLFDVEKGRNVI